MIRRTRRKVLVIARGHLADVITSLPALRDLRAGLPDAHITLLVNEYVRGLLEECPYVDDVLYGFQYGERRPLQRTLDLARLAAKVAGRYDTVLALRWSPRMTPLLAALTGARTRVAYGLRGPFRTLLTHDLGAEVLGPVPNRMLNAATLAAIGLGCDLAYDPIDWLPAEVGARVGSVLAAMGISPAESFAVVHMSSHWGCNEWRSEKWARLIDHLWGRYRLRVVVTGRGEEYEHEKFREVADLCRMTPVSAIGRTGVAELIGLISRASLLVASDTAVTQVAIAQRVPAIIMFGIEEIEANGPLGDERMLMRTLQHWEGPELAPEPNQHCRFGQSHCHWEHCEEDSSRRRITVSDVAEEIAALARDGHLRVPVAGSGRAAAEAADLKTPAGAG